MEREKVADIVKEYFDSQGIRYEVETDKDQINIITVFRGDTEEETSLVKFIIYDHWYRIVAWNSIVIPTEYRPGCYVALNEYNYQHLVKAFLFAEDGRIIYDYSVITKNNAYSKESIIEAFDLVVRTVSDETPRIFRQAYNNSQNLILPTPEAKKKSWFSRK